jgi:spore coat polysaccharide biosynthesis predicted glycosyltransferase SpsG
MRSPDLRVLFRAPAGPRRGFGHLLRCRSLARALGVTPMVALRGTPATCRAARRLGVRVVKGDPVRALRAVRPDVVVVDDPIAREGARWIGSARHLRVPVIGLHDLGIGCLDADLVVDGSVVTRVRRDPRRVRTGLRCAVLDPAFARLAPRSDRRAPSVLIALGGGPRLRRALAIAQAIVARVPTARVRIAGGLASPGWGEASVPGVAWTGPLDGLRLELTRCDVAVVAGGVSLYEACAAGVAAVALPVVREQAPTVRGFGLRGGCLPLPQSAQATTVAARVAGLLTDVRRRGRLGRIGRLLVDGRGALRVATEIRKLAAEWAA